jgi:hypothetical protein
MSDNVMDDVYFQETKFKSGVVKGSYSFLQPDNVIQTVTYVADPKHGFNAVVEKSLPSIHPPHPHPKD